MFSALLAENSEKTKTDVGASKFKVNYAKDLIFKKKIGIKHLVSWNLY